MSYLRQSTTANVSVGPFVRSANGFTLMPSLNIPATAVYLSKNGSILNAKSEASSAVYDKNGFYVVRLNGTDTNTVGDLGISINSASALPVWK
jgi:hypothetical protein